MRWHEFGTGQKAGLGLLGDAGSTVNKEVDDVVGDGVGVDIGEVPDWVAGDKVAGVGTHFVDESEEGDCGEAVEGGGFGATGELGEDVLEHIAADSPMRAKGIPVGVFGLEFVAEEFDVPVGDGIVGVAGDDVASDAEEDLFGLEVFGFEFELLHGLSAGSGAFEGGSVEVTFASEMVVDEGKVDAGFGGDFADGDGGIAEIREQPSGRFDKTLLRVVGGKGFGGSGIERHRTNLHL